MTKAINAGALAIALVALASLAAGGAKMKITSSAFQEGGTFRQNSHVTAATAAHLCRLQRFLRARKAWP
jgi:hypothetical protein